MIRRLRRKFILIAMLSVFAVLLLIMGAINVASYRSVVETADDRMELVLYPERYRGGLFVLLRRTSRAGGAF